MSLFAILPQPQIRAQGKSPLAGPDGRIVLQVEAPATRASMEYPMTGLLRSIAELISALGWPLLAVFINITCGKQLRNVFDTLGSRLQSAQTVKRGWLEMVLQKSDDLAKANPMARSLTSD